MQPPRHHDAALLKGKVGFKIDVVFTNRINDDNTWGISLAQRQRQRIPIRRVPT